jgi:hypothetical protein
VPALPTLREFLRSPKNWIASSRSSTDDCRLHFSPRPGEKRRALCLAGGLVEVRNRAQHGLRERAAVSQAASRRRGRRRGRRARSLTSSGKMQHDQAWPARHEDVRYCPSGSVSQNLTVRGPFDNEHLGRSSTGQLAQFPFLPSPPRLSLAGGCSTTARRSPSAASRCGVP